MLKRMLIAYSSANIILYHNGRNMLMSGYFDKLKNCFLSAIRVTIMVGTPTIAKLGMILVAQKKQFNRQDAKSQCGHNTTQDYESESQSRHTTTHKK